MNLFARVLLFLLVVTSWVSVHAYADVAQGLSWLAKQQQITGDSALTFTPLIVFGVLLAAFLAIELYLDFLAINGRCDAFGSLIAGAIVATVNCRHCCWSIRCPSNCYCTSVYSSSCWQWGHSCSKFINL